MHMYALMNSRFLLISFVSLMFGAQANELTWIEGEKSQVFLPYTHLPYV